ncbi:glycosyltransferase [archaeon]|jgi:spore maturation protein CgeB|nr:glycosyltransferase [archaeon]MBT4647214.1 glycosyltransferase [archaeon]MBT4857942.1 glycosyltransferase [archaeon]
MKILLVGFYNPETMAYYVERTLLNMDHEVEVFGYRRILQKIKPDSLLSIGFRHFQGLSNLFEIKMNKDLRKKVSKKKYDLIIVFKGENIFPETLKFIKKHTKKLVNWFMDPFVALYKGYMFEIIPEFDKFFVKDRFLEKRLKEIGFHNVDFLMEGFDPLTFFRTNPSKKYESEIALVGNIYPYRKKLLDTIKKYDLKVWGDVTHFKPKNKMKYYQGRRAVTEEKNKIFNSAKIVLNSHNPWEVMSTNVRTFEICGSGSFQLVNTTDFLSQVFKPGIEIETYENQTELNEKVKYYLKNPEKRKQIATKGYERAKKDHTYEIRIKELFQSLEIKQ